MKLFCEVVADLLPSLRALVAEELMHEYKLSQKEIARRLFVTQPAVSQYLRKLRGADRNMLNGTASQEVKALCTQIYNNEIAEEELLKRFFDICNSIIPAGHSHDPEKVII